MVKEIVSCVFNTVCSVITVLFFVVTIPILVTQFQDYAERVAQGPYYHTVGDTRIINMDHRSLTFCRGFMLAVNRDESTVSATFYALSTSPTLNGRNELNHTLSIHGKEDYDYYYLHPGSNVTISACTHSTPFSFDIIRGRQNFELWRDGKRGRVFASFEVGSNAWCHSPSTNASFVVYNMTIPEEDDWYFAADADAATANLSLQRYEYTVMDSAVLSSCNAGGSNPDSCTIDKPNLDATYLLKIGQGPSGSNVEANVNCVVDDGLVAAVVVPVAFVLALILICCIVVCIFCCCICCIR